MKVEILIKRKLCFLHHMVKLKEYIMWYSLSEQSIFGNSFGYEGDASSWGNVLRSILEKR